MKNIPYCFRRRSYDTRGKELTGAVRLMVNIKAETEVYIGISAMSFIVDWGDGESDSSCSHRYEQAGRYKVCITGAAIHALNLSKVFISELILEKCIWLQHLNCAYNHLEKLNVSGCVNLLTLDCSYNRLTVLELEGLEDLIRLDCSHNILRTLRLANCCKLLYLYCAENILTTLDLSLNPELMEVDLGNNKLKAGQLNHCFNSLPMASEQVKSGIMLDGNPGEKDCIFSLLAQKGWQIV